MLTVALVGADGAGKSTVATRLPAALALPARRMYLGVSADSATHPLPTTTLVRRVRALAGRPSTGAGPPPLPAATDPAGASGPRRPHRGPAGQVRAAARLANRVSEEAYQEAVSRWHRSRGRVVVYDRFYPADFHAHDLSGRVDLSWDRRVHGAFLRRCFAAPDVVVVLDAAPEVLQARKGEGTLAELASRRAEYLAYASAVPPSTAVVLVDVTRPLDEVVSEVAGAIEATVARSTAMRRQTAATTPEAVRS